MKNENNILCMENNICNIQTLGTILIYRDSKWLKGRKPWRAGKDYVRK